MASAATYGVVHDQITARVCVEYFTVGHPPVFSTTDPTLLGLGWGILATWWVGVILGLALAIAARAGRRPPRSMGSLVRPVLILLAVMATFATVAGVTGYVAGAAGRIVLDDHIKNVLPPQTWAAFQGCAFAHSASYAVSFAGGGILIATVWVSRKPARLTASR